MFMADTMIRSPYKVLNVPDQDMDPWEFFHSLIWFNRFTEMIKSHIENIVGWIIISMYRLFFLNSSQCKIFEMLRVHTFNNLHRGIACRRSMLVGADQKDRPEPFPQRYMRPVKNRIYRNRGLMPTVFALKNLTPFHEIGFSMTALRTVKSIRPSKLFQILKTVILCQKTFLKLEKTDFAVVAHAYLQY